MAWQKIKTKKNRKSISKNMGEMLFAFFNSFYKVDVKIKSEFVMWRGALFFWDKKCIV